MKFRFPLALALAVTVALQGARAADASPPAAAPKSDSAPKLPTPPYQTAELSKVVNQMLNAAGRNYAAGEKTFQTIGCTLCHHFGTGDGGIGPDLTGVGGRMGTMAILESILEPSKEISNLFGNRTITTTDGKTITGHWDEAAETDDTVGIIEAYTFDPASKSYSWSGGKTTIIRRSDIESDVESKVSPMTPGLINSLKVDEVADLVAFLISGGNPEMKMFKPPAPAAAPPKATPAPAK